MALEIIKQATNVANACKNFAEVNKPQLTAAVATGCFLGAVYSATQETPGAKEAIEKKRAIDPSMSKLEEIAISIPEYKKTLAFTAAGLAGTYLAWRFEAIKYAALAATCAQLADENSSIRKAVREVTNNETAEKVENKAAEIRNEERTRTAGDDSDRDIPVEYHTVPFSLSYTGKSWYDTKHQACKKLNKAVEQLCKTGWLSFGEFCNILDDETHVLYCDLCDESIGWSCRIGDLEDAKNTLDWYFDPEMDEYGRLGYTIHVSAPR